MSKNQDPVEGVESPLDGLAEIEDAFFPQTKQRLELTLRPDAGFIPGLFKLLVSGSTEELNGLYPQTLHARVVEVSRRASGNLAFILEIDEHV